MQIQIVILNKLRLRLVLRHPRLVVQLVALRSESTTTTTKLLNLLGQPVRPPLRASELLPLQQRQQQRRRRNDINNTTTTTATNPKGNSTRSCNTTSTTRRRPSTSSHHTKMLLPKCVFCLLAATRASSLSWRASSRTRGCT